MLTIKRSNTSVSVHMFLETATFSESCITFLTMKGSQRRVSLHVPLKTAVVFIANKANAALIAHFTTVTSHVNARLPFTATDTLQTAVLSDTN